MRNLVAHFFDARQSQKLREPQQPQDLQNPQLRVGAARANPGVSTSELDDQACHTRRMRDIRQQVQFIRCPGTALFALDGLAMLRYTVVLRH